MILIGPDNEARLLQAIQDHCLITLMELQQVTYCAVIVSSFPWGKVGGWGLREEVNPSKSTVRGGGGNPMYGLHTY